MREIVVDNFAGLHHRRGRRRQALPQIRTGSPLRQRRMPANPDGACAGQSAETVYGLTKTGARKWRA